jgi:hypothetical protein
MNAPATSQLIGHRRIVAADLWDRRHPGSTGHPILKTKRHPSSTAC